MERKKRCLSLSQNFHCFVRMAQNVYLNLEKKTSFLHVVAKKVCDDLTVIYQDNGQERASLLEDSTGTENSVDNIINQCSSFDKSNSYLVPVTHREI